MSDERIVAVKTKFDGSSVDGGIAINKRSLKELAEAGKEAARKIDEEFQKTSKSTRTEAEKVAIETKRASDAIIREIARLESAGKGRSAFLEQLYTQKGVDPNVLRPLIDQLADVEARSKRAAVAASGFAGGVDVAAKSAQALSYQLRQVGPQFTDIVTSLASGQAPLTVLIQQGGQLKDVFGGIGPAARALGGYLLSLINPYTVAAAAIAAIGYAYNRGAQEEKEFTKAILLSGNAAGVTSNQLAGMASSLKNITGSQAAAAEALTLFVRAGDVGAKNLEKFAASALLFEKTTGQAVSETVKQFEALKKAPLEASVKLNEATGFLTDSVYRQIKALEEQGKKAEAAALAQNALADANDKISRRLIDNAGSIERAYDAVVKVLRKVGSAILDIGRPEAAADVAKRLEAQIKQIENSGAGGGGRAGAFGAFQGDSRQLNALREQLDNVRQIAAAEALGAKAQAEAVERVKIRAQFDADLVKHAEKREKLETAIKGVIDLQTRGIITQGEATKRIGQLREEFKEAKGPKDTSVARDAEAQRRAVAEALGVSADYVETLGRLERARENETLSVEAYTKAILDLIAKQSSSKEIAKAQEEAQKALEKAQKERLDTAKKINEIEAKSLSTYPQIIAALEAEVEKQREANEEYGLTAFALRNLRLARLDDQIAQADSTLIAAQSNSIGADRIAQMQRELQLLRERRALVATGNAAQSFREAETAAIESAKNAASEWQKASDQIGQGLTDSLFRAAEAGKGFFATLRDSIKGMFNNLILKPIIQYGTTAALGAVGSLLGGNAGATGTDALGSLGSIASLISTGSSLNNASGLVAGVGSYLSGAASTAAGVQGASALAIGAEASALAGVGGTAASSIMGVLGAIPVWGWAAMAAVAVAAIFSGDRGGPKGGGSFSNTGERLFTPNTSDADLAKLGGTLTTSIAGALTKFGGNAAGLQFGLGFDTDPQGTANNRIASFLRDSSGRTVLDNIAGRDVGRDDAVLKTELTTETKRLMLAALQAADLQNGFSDVFKRLNAAEAAPEAIDALLALAEQLKALGDAADRLPGVMSSIADLSATAREELIGLAGGLDALTSGLQSYYENFFSADEQLANAGANLATDFAKIGIDFEALKADSDGPRRAFRDLVEGLKKVDGGTSAAFVALIKLNPALDAWIKGTEEAARAAEAAAKVEADAALALAAATAKAAADLAEAQRKLQIAALETQRTDTTAAMQALTNANGDLTRSLYELENPIQTTAEKFLALGDTMQGMLDRMAQILGTGSLSLLDQLQAAVNTRTGIASARAGVAGTIEGLQIQGFTNRGDISGGVAFIKALERAAFAELQTTSDPAGVAGKITNLITQRYQLEAQLISGAGSARQTALQDEIATLEQMASIADQLKSTILDLKTGSLSALAPQDQVAAASAAYGDTLSRARAGDVKALQALPGMATQFLTEQQSFDASGGSYGATFTGVLADLESVGASLSGVPTQLSLAQAQLTETGIVVDNTGAMAADLQSIDTALTVRSEAQEAGIDALVVAIRAQITGMDGEREALRGQWGREADRWAALGLTLEGIEASIRTLSENATLAAAA